MSQGSSNSTTPSNTPSIAIIGTGFAGLGMAIRLLQAGIDDFVIYEKGEEVGGTWRDNHYPGCACDVQSHLYSFSFEPNPEWTRMFAPQPEILRYLRHCADKYGLRRYIRFNTQLVGARYDEGAGQWQLQTADARAVAQYMAAQQLHPGDAVNLEAPGAPQRQHSRVQALVLGIGGLSTPAYPQLPGLETFKGHAFHSQDWDHGYELKGKRVAVIGTGASAIQFVPQVQKQVAHLDLYQRTPPWIIPKPDRGITGVERKLFRRWPSLQKLYRGLIYSRLETRVFGFAIGPQLMKAVQLVALWHIRRQIPSAALRKQVTPDYTIGCKRILISDDYYPALAQPNVEVISTGIREVRAHSIITQDGQERAIDAIIYGTGFRALDPVPRGVFFGRGGVDMVSVWEQGGGPEAFKGTTAAGCPNLFMIVGPNTGLGHNSMVYMIESQVVYILQALQLMRARGLHSLEVKPAAQQRYNERLQARLNKAIWSVGGCKSWYLHPSGRNVTLWPSFTFAFRRLLRRFDEQNYELREARTASGSAKRAAA